MRTRCENPNHENFSHYGGRGISVCRRWSGVGGYERFVADVSTGYAVGLQIDRIDNDGNYEPSNVRWVTPSENSRNRRSNLHLTVYGRTQTAAAWAEEMGIEPITLYSRLRHGWSHERAVTERVGKYSRKRAS